MQRFLSLYCFPQGFLLNELPWGQWMETLSASLGWFMWKAITSFQVFTLPHHLSKLADASDGSWGWEKALGSRCLRLHWKTTSLKEEKCLRRQSHSQHSGCSEFCQLPHQARILSFLTWYESSISPVRMSPLITKASKAEEKMPGLLNGHPRGHRPFSE